VSTAPRSVGVVGAGVAGLAVASLLAQRRHDVTVYDRGPVGGKLQRVHLAGHAIDTGPSLFTFPGAWRALLARLGETDPLDLQLLPGLGVHDVRGERVPLPVPPGHAMHAAWLAYERRVTPLRAHVQTLLMTPPDPLDPRFARASAALARVTFPHVTAQAWLRARHLPPALTHAIATHALNAGVGPRAASVLYALLPALMAGDAHRPREGMYALVQALQGFAQARGVTLRVGDAVTRVDPDRGEVLTASGLHRHDMLVSTVDPTRLAPLLGRSKAAPARTVSGVTLYAVHDHLPDLPPTSVVAPDDFGLFEAAMRSLAPPQDTLALVHRDGSVLSVLLAAPADARTYGPDHPWVRAQYARLERLLHLPPLDAARDVLTLSPSDYALGGATGGAIYGRQFPAWRAGPFHPEPYRLRPRLWQAGTGVHPGGGLPAVLGGALIVDELLHRALRARA